MEPHRRRDVQRPGLRRQPERRRLEAHRLPRRAVRLLRRGDALRSRPLRKTYHDPGRHPEAGPRTSGALLPPAWAGTFSPRGRDARDADPTRRARGALRRGRSLKETKGKGKRKWRTVNTPTL